nr:hypothetical protein [uncultured Chitinophaga sp.]
MIPQQITILFVNLPARTGKNDGAPLSVTQQLAGLLCRRHQQVAASRPSALSARHPAFGADAKQIPAILIILQQVNPRK